MNYEPRASRRAALTVRRVCKSDPGAIRARRQLERSRIDSERDGNAARPGRANA